jgi:hypothetical protein
MRDLFLSEKEYTEIAKEIANGKSVITKNLELFLMDSETKGLQEICKELNESEKKQFEMAFSQYEYLDNDGVYFKSFDSCFVDENENDFIPTKNVIVALAKSIVLRNKVYEQIWDNGALKVAEKILKEV